MKRSKMCLKFTKSKNRSCGRGVHPTMWDGVPGVPLNHKFQDLSLNG